MARANKNTTSPATNDVPANVPTWSPMELAGRNAAGVCAEASALIIAAKLTTRDTKKSEEAKALQSEFLRGYVSRACNVDGAAADAILASPANDTKKPDNEKRTAPQELAVGSGKTLWSRACDNAGLPSAGNGKKGASSRTSNATPVAADQIIIPTGIGPEDLMLFFGALTKAFGLAVNTNRATANKGTLGPLFDKANNDLIAWSADMQAALAEDKLANEKAKAKPAKPAIGEFQVAPNAQAAMLAAMKAELMAELMASMKKTA